MIVVKGASKIVKGSRAEQEEVRKTKTELPSMLSFCNVNFSNSFSCVFFIDDATVHVDAGSTQTVRNTLNPYH